VAGDRETAGDLWHWTMGHAGLFYAPGSVACHGVALSLLRCVLQEGEKWVMMTYILLAEQGAYDVVANLGSLMQDAAQVVCELVRFPN
jgi:hypothetical protein